MRILGGAPEGCASFGRAAYGGVKGSAWYKAPPKIGGCSRCARPAGTLAAEKYVLAGGAGQNMISFSFPACGRGNSARRALPGESVGRKVLDILKEGFLLPKPSPWGGRCPSAHTGADEGATDSPNGAGEERRPGDSLILLQGKVGYRIAPSSVTFGDSFPPRGSLRR